MLTQEDNNREMYLCNSGMPESGQAVVSSVVNVPAEAKSFLASRNRYTFVPLFFKKNPEKCCGLFH